MRAAALIVLAVVSGPSAAFAQLSGTNTPVPDRTQQREIEAARARQDAAQLRLQAARAAVRAKFEADEEFVAANRELTEASRAFDAARKPVLERLRESDEYRKAQDEARQASERVEKARDAEERADPSTRPTTAPVSQDVLEAVYDKLEQQTEISRMEAEAIESDEAARAARLKHDAARKRMAAVQARYRAELLNDPEFVAAQREYQDAQAAVRAAGVGTGSGSGTGGR